MQISKQWDKQPSCKKHFDYYGRTEQTRYFIETHLHELSHRDSEWIEEHGALPNGLLVREPSYTVFQNLDGRNVHFVETEIFDSLTINVFGESLALSASVIDIRNSYLGVCDLYITRDIHGKIPKIIVDLGTELSVKNLYINEDIDLEELIAGGLSGNISHIHKISETDPVDIIERYNGDSSTSSSAYDSETLENLSSCDKFDDMVFFEECNLALLEA